MAQTNTSAAAISNANVIGTPVLAFTAGLTVPDASDVVIWDRSSFEGEDVRVSSRQLAERPIAWPATVGDRPDTTPGPAWAVTQSPDWYAIDVRIPKEKRLNDPGIERDLPFALGVGVAEHQRRMRGTQYAAAETQAIPDGENLWANAHPTRDGGVTRDNLMGSAPDRTAWFTMRTLMARWRDYRGQLSSAARKTKYVVIPPELIDSIAAIVNMQVGGSTGNDAQATLSSTYGIAGVIEYPELTSTDWGVEALDPMPGSRPFKWLQRAAPMMYAPYENKDGSVSYMYDFADAYVTGPDPDNSFFSAP